VEVCTVYFNWEIPHGCNTYHLGWCQLVCRQHQFAIRATLLSTETLKSRNIYLDAAMQFMRMTAEVMYKLLYQVNVHLLETLFKGQHLFEVDASIRLIPFKFYNNCLISCTLICSFLSSIRVQTHKILVYASFQVQLSAVKLSTF